MTMRHPADGRVHFSELKQHSRSAAHVAHAVSRARELTRPMVVGGVADCIVFGGRGVAVYPGKVRSGKEWEAFKAAHHGHYLPIQSEYDDAQGAAEAVLAHPGARDLLDHGAEYQRVMQWDSWGLPCAAGIPGERGGFDVLNSRHPKRRPYIADLKITASTEPEELSRHAINMHWVAQGAWYLDGAHALSIEAVDFFLIACESSPPHVVTVLRLTPEALALGRRLLSKWTEQHRACEAAGVWPGYVASDVDMIMPEWAMERVELEI
jgi:PDDEXK-like domain of unknown function (DUF3799)